MNVPSEVIALPCLLLSTYYVESEYTQLCIWKWKRLTQNLVDWGRRKAMLQRIPEGDGYTLRVEGNDSNCEGLPCWKPLPTFGSAKGSLNEWPRQWVFRYRRRLRSLTWSSSHLQRWKRHLHMNPVCCSSRRWSSESGTRWVWPTKMIRPFWHSHQGNFKKQDSITICAAKST